MIALVSALCVLVGAAAVAGRLAGRSRYSTAVTSPQFTLYMARDGIAFA